MSVLIEKPQFDPNVLKAGMAINVKHNRMGSPGARLPYGSDLYEVNVTALLTKIDPLEIKAAYFSNKEERLVEVSIPVEYVASKLIDISVVKAV
ncbi:hypothetical protein [Sporomusa aerivorans]|uniref:hypothetical protein n=1 Tax=Sporomusa aerivorans TaxID=204936 RepID=UPI00352B0545